MVNRNHGSNFEKHGVAFSENAPDITGLGVHAADDEKLSDVRSEDLNEKA